MHRVRPYVYYVYCYLYDVSNTTDNYLRIRIECALLQYTWHRHGMAALPSCAWLGIHNEFDRT